MFNMTTDCCPESIYQNLHHEMIYGTKSVNNLTIIVHKSGNKIENDITLELKHNTT